jgi:hypothetical protein
MTAEERIVILEQALTSYIEKYGFTEKTRAYFMEHYLDSTDNDDSQSSRRKHPH